MRIAWAVVLGAAVAVAVAWWLARQPSPSAEAAASAPTKALHDDGPPPSPVLYRWRDEAGVVQVTDVPPKGRDYSTVDVDALARRNTIQPDPKIAAEAEQAR